MVIALIYITLHHISTMKHKKCTSIRVGTDITEMLRNMGTKGQTYEDVILDLIGYRTDKDGFVTSDNPIDESDPM